MRLCQAADVESHTMQGWSVGMQGWSVGTFWLGASSIPADHGERRQSPPPPAAAIHRQAGDAIDGGMQAAHGFRFLVKSVSARLIPDVGHPCDGSSYRSAVGANSLATTARSNARRSAARLVPKVPSNRACAATHLFRAAWRRLSPALVR